MYFLYNHLIFVSYYLAVLGTLGTLPWVYSSSSIVDVENQLGNQQKQA